MKLKADALEAWELEKWRNKRQEDLYQREAKFKHTKAQVGPWKESQHKVCLSVPTTTQPSSPKPSRTHGTEFTHHMLTFVTLIGLVA